MSHPRRKEVDSFYEKARWPLGTLVRDPDDHQRRGAIVRRVAPFWVDRDSKPPMVRWHGKLDAVEIPWERLEQVR